MNGYICIFFVVFAKSNNFFTACFKGENLRHDHLCLKENNLGPGDKIRYTWWVLKVLFLFCKAQLVHTNFLYPYQMLSFYEIKSFTRAFRNTDLMVSAPKCPG